MSGHTPGPWEVRGKQSIRAGKAYIARANWLNGGANARLIAAAPDLFSELQVREGDLVMLRRAIEEGDPKAEILFRIDDMIRKTRAAIAKADARS